MNNIGPGGKTRRGRCSVFGTLDLIAVRTFPKLLLLS